MSRYKYEVTGVMLAVGILVFIAFFLAYGWVAAAAAALGAMAVYLAGARFAVDCYTFLSRWAHRSKPGKPEPADSMMTVLWPLALPVALLMYGAMGIVNRVLPDAAR
jgi:hypothetical protein